MLDDIDWMDQCPKKEAVEGDKSYDKEHFVKLKNVDGETTKQ